MTLTDNTKDVQTNLGTDYMALNSSINFWEVDADGNKVIPFHKDKEAARQYFLNHVNPNTVFFHSLEEKLAFLVENGYYAQAFLDLYDPAFVKKVFKHAYDKKYRFPTFMSAYKFYTSYALRTFDGTRYLERYEDRVAIVALSIANGDKKLALNIVDVAIGSMFQVATPTFLNSGRAAGGALVSCFLLNLEDSLNSIFRGVNSAAQLSKIGGGVALNLNNLRGKGDPIKKMLNQASGIIPPMKVLEDTGKYVNQLGQRAGALAAYINAHHIDVLEFLDSKRENADEAIRIKTLSLGLMIPDVTFELAQKGEQMYLFSPYDVEQEYGRPFSWVDVSKEYSAMVDNPRIRKEKVPGGARGFLARLAEIQSESGYPYVIFENAVNETSPLITEQNGKRIIMSNLCVSGDTQILTGNGYRNVKDLYESQEELTVIVDDRARTFNGNSKTVSEQSSTKMMLTAKNAEVFSLKTKEGFRIKATEWHKFYIQEKDGSVRKVQLNELSVGDKLLVQPAEGAFGSTHQPELAYLAGTWAGDGTFAQGKNYTSAKLTLHDSKREFAPRLEKAASSVLSGRTDLLQRQSVLTPSFVEVDERKASMTSAPLAKLFAEVDFTAQTKHSVPKFVFEGDKETQIAYLDGLFSTDGTFTRTSVGSESVQLSSIAEDLLVDIQRMLLNLNIYSKIYNTRSTETKVLLPDGKGSLAEYTQKPIWSLRVSERASVDLLTPLVSWKEEVQQRIEQAKTVRSDKKPYETHKYAATVESISSAGYEDVYDVTVENGHSLIFNGLSTGNCTEIFQPTLPSTIRDDQTYEVLGQDISCNLGSFNVLKLIQSGDFEKHVETAVRMLTFVSDASSIDAVPTVKNGNQKAHAIGIGAMNLHGAFGHYEMQYGDEESLDLTNAYFQLVTFHALRASNKIARERKETFVGFEDTEYASGVYFEKFISPESQQLLQVKTDKVRRILEETGSHIPTLEDWQELAASIKKYGIYNQNLQAIAPTGSISYVANSTPSAMPITGRIENRKEGKVGKVTVPAAEMNMHNLEYFKTAYEIPAETSIDVYSVLQYYVDQGASQTLHFPAGSGTKDITRAQLYAFSKGRPSKKEPTERQLMLRQFPQGKIKSLYYYRIAADIVADLKSDTIAAASFEECVSCAL